MKRWFCPHCGIVRDTEDASSPPWCRHNALDQPAERMTEIPSWHPFAEGVLPWGDSDPARVTP